MKLGDIKHKKAPFKVVDKRKKGNPITVKGFSENDPHGVGGGFFANIPCVYFEEGGWILVDDLLKYYELFEEEDK